MPHSVILDNDGNIIGYEEHEGGSSKAFAPPPVDHDARVIRMDVDGLIDRVINAIAERDKRRHD